jgi:hypothetical protein
VTASPVRKSSRSAAVSTSSSSASAVIDDSDERPCGRDFTRPQSRRQARCADTVAAGSYQPSLTPGEEFTVCVTVTVRIPLLPEFIDANTATGEFVVERDRYVDG